jgi:hypothetical protein
VAQKVTVALVDDLDGSPAAETVAFTLDGVAYEIDLNEENAAAFRKQLERYITRARRVRRGQSRQPRRRLASRQYSVEIRSWAKESGIAVSDRGRLPASVTAAYEQRTGREAIADARRPPGPSLVPPRPPKPPKPRKPPKPSRASERSAEASPARSKRSADRLRKRD